VSSDWYRCDQCGEMKSGTRIDHERSRGGNYEGVKIICPDCPPKRKAGGGGNEQRQTD